MKKIKKVKNIKEVKKIITIVLILILFTESVFAEEKDIQAALSKVWQSLGGEMVSNGAKYYKGQRGGHYTLGSMYFARQKKNRPLINVNFPEIDFDKSCYNQGVMNFGGLSFISGDELKNKIESIGKNAGMMFIYLGISSVSPVISETLQEVYSKLQELGGFLADECQAAKQIVSMVGDKMSQHSEIAKNIFSKVETSLGSKKDLGAVYKQFPEGKASALEQAASKNESMILEDINMAWKAMEKLKIQSTSLKELLMTISGTVIIKAAQNDKSPPKFQYISSTVTNPSVLEALLKGSKSMTILSCGEEGTSKCLDVSEQSKLIEEKDSFEYKVLEHFDKIKEAIKEDKELDQSTQNFLANAGLSVYKIYDVLYQYTGANPEYEQGIFVEVVAWNILYNYLSDMLKEASEAANNLQVAASSELKEFRDSIKETQKLLASFEVKDLSRYKLQLMLVKRVEGMEDAMSDEMANILSMSKSDI